MLKIKDNVDLKELEKFGFKKYNLVGKTHYEIEYKNGNNIKVSSYTRFIHFNIYSVSNCIENVIYDLIKADLVEKVEDKGE